MPSKAASTCPGCKQPTVHAYRPFCSRGCRDRDLNAWFDEDYRIAVQPGEDDPTHSADPLEGDDDRELP